VAHYQEFWRAGQAGPGHGWRNTEIIVPIQWLDLRKLVWVGCAYGAANTLPPDLPSNEGDSFQVAAWVMPSSGAEFWCRVLGPSSGAEFWGRVLGPSSGAEFWGRVLVPSSGAACFSPGSCARESLRTLPNRRCPTCQALHGCRHRLPGETGWWPVRARWSWATSPRRPHALPRRPWRG
jgi:hypothetical protein